MGLSATLDLKRPAMESECQYNMQKEDGLEEEDVSMRRPLSDGTLSESNHHQNGHMIDSNGVNMSKSHSESAQSAVINILGNASLNTDLHIEEVDFSRSDKLNATVSEAHSTQHQNGGDGLKMNSHLKNGGSEINSEFSNTSQQLLKHPVEGVFANAQTASKIDDIDGRVGNELNDNMMESQQQLNIIKSASFNHFDCDQSVLSSTNLIDPIEAIDRDPIFLSPDKTNDIIGNQASTMLSASSAATYTQDESDLDSPLQLPAIPNFESDLMGSNSDADSTKDSDSCFKQHQSSMDLSENNLAKWNNNNDNDMKMNKVAQSDDPLNQSIVYDKSMEQQQQSPQIEQTCSAGLNDPLADGGIIDDIPNESPASPEPMRELTWLPPLYVPEIPLSTGDNERVTSPENCRAPPPSYEDDPQMMQAVIDLSATVDAKKLSVPPRKPPPLVPVPIEPHSVVRTYDRTPPCFSRSAYAKRNTAVATSWKHRDREHHQKQPQSSGNTASVGTSNETVKRHSSNPNIAHEPSTSATQGYSTHDSMMAGTSRMLMAPLTVNTEMKRGNASAASSASRDMPTHKKDEFGNALSAPLSSNSERSNSTINDWKWRRKSFNEASPTDDRIQLPNEKQLNRALDLIKTATDQRLSRDSSMQPSPSPKISSSKSTTNVKKEVFKRKTMQDRLNRLREQNALLLTVPSFENVNTTQMAILLRRFKKYWKVRNYLSEELIQHVLNGQEEPSTDQQQQERFNESDNISESVVNRECRTKLRAFREASDPDATESSTDEEEDEWSDRMELEGDKAASLGPSTSSPVKKIRITRNNPLLRLYRMRVQLGALQCRAEYEEEECARMIENIRQQISELDAKKERFVTPDRLLEDGIEQEQEDGKDFGCARCIPINGKLRRKLLRRSRNNTRPGKGNEEIIAETMNAADRIPAYASVDDRVSKDVSSLGAIPLRRRIDVYYRRKSMRPAYFNRTSWEQAPWITYLQTKQASKMSDESRKRKRDATNNSSIRDHSYSPLRKARRNSCSSSNRRRVSLLKHAGSRLVRRSLDYKRYGERMQRKNKVLYGNNANNNNAAYACSSTGGFGMASALNHNHQNITDVDAAMSSDYCIDGTIVGLPQKIDYKEITIPKWRRISEDMLTVKAESTCMRAAELTCAAEISRLHLPYELSERKRFQQYRDTVASKALSSNGNNNSTTSKLSGAANHNSSSKISGSSAAHSQSKNVAPHSQSKMSQHIVGGGAARLSISPNSTHTAGNYSPSTTATTSTTGTIPSPAAPHQSSTATAIFHFDEEHSNSNSAWLTDNCAVSSASGAVATVPVYDRPSVVRPYSPRLFPLPATLIHRHLT